jgi:hypothetical protein
MKILKYFFYSLLVIFLLFVANGILNSEQEFEAEILVNETPEKCWEVFRDAGKKVDWVSNFQSIQTISETSDMVGSKYLIKVIDTGQEYEMTEMVTAYEPAVYYSIERENDVLINHIDYSFEVAGEGTRIKTTNTLAGKDVLMKSIFPFMKGMFISQIETELTKLKEIIEE